MNDQQRDNEIMGMPWLVVLAFVLLAAFVMFILAMFVMFISMGVGMAYGENAALIVLVSAFAVIALVVAGVRRYLSSQKNRP